jgi:hypothetical protein
MRLLSATVTILVGLLVNGSAVRAEQLWEAVQGGSVTIRGITLPLSDVQILEFSPLNSASNTGQERHNLNPESQIEIRPTPVPQGSSSYQTR